MLERLEWQRGYSFDESLDKLTGVDGMIFPDNASNEAGSEKRETSCTDDKSTCMDASAKK